MTFSVSDVAARQIARLRRQRGWTARRLATECAALGATHLTPSVIANIETGRPDAQGRRRRDLTVDELFVFAYALAAPLPVLLLPLAADDPVAGDNTVSPTPNTHVSVEAALRWVQSKEPPPTGDGSAREPETWAMLAGPLWRYQELWKLLSATEDFRALIDQFAVQEALEGSNSERADRLRRLREALDRELREVSKQLNLMAEQGVTPPPLPDQLRDELERIGHNRIQDNRPEGR